MTEQSPSAPPTKAQRRIARIAGIWFVITFVSAIGALVLYGPVLDETDYILGARADDRVRLGALLEVILVIANIATAVVLYPILKRQQRRHGHWLCRESCG